ncbi:MAG: hypothetical protein IT310_08610, partial [Anaerolineales bacterium]|nr:hypothetical protein [Anaerolineales bacterium]
DTFSRARNLVEELLASYTRPELDSAQATQLHAFMLDLAKKAGVEELPPLEESQPA